MLQNHQPTVQYNTHAGSVWLPSHEQNTCREIMGAQAVVKVFSRAALTDQSSEMNLAPKWLGAWRISHLLSRCVKFHSWRGCVCVREWVSVFWAFFQYSGSVIRGNSIQSYRILMSWHFDDGRCLRKAPSTQWGLMTGEWWAHQETSLCPPSSAQ